MQLIQGECLEKMKSMEDNSIDAIVTDPPYGISFMAKKWDYDIPTVEVFQEMLRVLKPGGHILCACGTRTQHRMAVNIEDAGFEIRDIVSWIYGSGFPKSMNISKQLDKLAGAEREVVGSYSRKSPATQRKIVDDSGKTCDGRNAENFKKYIEKQSNIKITIPATKEAKQWEGFGTALKPAQEFFTLARKPLSESTIAKNVLKWGVGGINIDGCRVEVNSKDHNIRNNIGYINTQSNIYSKESRKFRKPTLQQGRFPANLILSDDEEVLRGFPETKPSKVRISEDKDIKQNTFSLDRKGTTPRGHSDNGGSASRFFYCAKASKSERNGGLEGFEEKMPTHGKGHEKGELQVSDSKLPNANFHPTVKPLSLMTYLCRLITPPKGTILDPFMGSGTTGISAKKEGFNFVGIELEEDYFRIAEARINA